MKRQVGLYALLAAAFTMFAFVGDARAAAGGAPQRFEDSGWVQFGPDYTYCYGSSSFVHQVQTPSGNVVLVLRTDRWQTIRYPGADSSWTNTYDGTQLVQDGEFHQANVKGTDTSTFTLPDGSVVTCSFTMYLHLVDDRYQFDRTELDCPL